MNIVHLAHETDFEAWRQAARALLLQGVHPDHTLWQVGQHHSLLAACGQGSLLGSEHMGLDDMNSQHMNSEHMATDLFGSQQVDAATRTEAGLKPAQAKEIRVPAQFIELCRVVIMHHDAQRFGRMYRMLWRLQQEPGLLRIAFDPEVLKLMHMQRAVRRDMHKMKAFVRFREVDDSGDFVAWFEPEHFIVDGIAKFFYQRFSRMRWTIMTPQKTLHWDGEKLASAPGGSKSGLPQSDPAEELWLSYYQHIFNPARLKVKAMQAEMPKRYWRNLPEAVVISELIGAASQRTAEMVAKAPEGPRRKVIPYKSK